MHVLTNDNGQRLCETAVRTSIMILVSSTKFKHKKEHKITWTSPDNKTHTQIDHVLVIKRKQSSILDVRSVTMFSRAQGVWRKFARAPNGTGSWIGWLSRGQK